MHCDAIQDILALSYADGTCSPAERAAVEAHVSACAECRAFQAALGSVRETLGAAPRLAPPASVWAAIEDRLSPATNPSWIDVLAEGWHQWWTAPVARPVMVLAGVALVCALMVVVAPPGGAPPGGAPRGSVGQVAAGTTSAVSVEDEIVDDGFGSLAEAVIFSDDVV